MFEKYVIAENNLLFNIRRDIILFESRGKPMKKLVFALLALVFLTGCTNINNLSISQIVSTSLENQSKLSNQYRTGYKYYLPRGLSVVSQSDYNEKLNTDRYTYYLYVDIISYYNKVDNEFNPVAKAYYSKEIKGKNKYGYLQIRRINDKYLVEIMYNYAKIEVIVKPSDLNITVANAITILNSIQYNKDIIENVMGKNVLKNKETEINIFESKKTDSNTILYKEIYGQYDDSKETHDSDLIKEGVESGTTK